VHAHAPAALRERGGGGEAAEAAAYDFGAASD